MTICGMSAFAVAIGGKADMPFCTAYVRYDPKRTCWSRATPLRVLPLVGTMPSLEPRGRQ